MFCSNCGNRVDGNTRFCPVCGAPLASGNTARPQGQPHMRQGQPSGRPNSYQQRPSSGQPSFEVVLNGTRPMAQMPIVSLIMFFIYGTYSVYNLTSFFGRFTFPFVSFSSWINVFFAFGVTAMFAIAYFKKTRKRLFFLIGLAILALLYTINIFSGWWFNIVFGLFMLGCVGVIAIYYLFEGRVFNDKIKMAGCFGLMFFGMLRTLFYCLRFYPFGLFFVYMIPIVALALGFLFYSPYLSRR